MDVPVSKLARLLGRERRSGPEAGDSAAAIAAVTPAQAQHSQAQHAQAQPAQPPPLPGAEQHTAPASGSASPPARATAHQPPFSSVIRHLSLYGWLRWIHSNRSDATLRIKTDDASGTVWCQKGLIIDAEWEGRTAEDALRELLPCSSGVVTIDFEPVVHLRRVVTPTHQLLRLSEAEAAPGSAEPRQARSLAASKGSAAPKDRFTELALLLSESIAPVAASQPPKGRGWLRRRAHVATALIVSGLALAGFAVGRLRGNDGLAGTHARDQAAAASSEARAPLPPQLASAASPTANGSEPRELAPIPFVSIEVEPAEAEIWLDRQLAGRGVLKLAAIHDGMMHELRFMASGHETKTLFFRDTPPAGRVVLGRLSARDGAAHGAASEATAEPPRTGADEAPGVSAEPEAVRRPPRPRALAAIAPAPPAPRARVAPVEAPAPAKPAAERAPRIELIEVHTPRVQVLD